MNKTLHAVFFLRRSLNAISADMFVAAVSGAVCGDTVVKSEREPETIRYYMLLDRSEAEGYQSARFPVKTIFQKVFGPGDPGELVAIGIKSDSNNLGGESLTYPKTLRLIR